MGVVVIGFMFFCIVLSSLFCCITLLIFSLRGHWRLCNCFSYMLQIYYSLLEDKRNLRFLVNQSPSVQESFEWSFDYA